MELKTILETRAAVKWAVRTWFDEEGFVEVTTPVAVPHPNLDPNVCPVSVTVRDFKGRPHDLWLHTSPELSMKKLLSRGSGNIYQIGPVFRDGEWTRQHRWEFTMLEWYRVQADYEEAMRDTIRVFRTACRAVTGDERVAFQGTTYDLAGPWEEMTMAEAFYRYAGVESWDPEELMGALEDLGCRAESKSTVQDLFFALYVDRVEPMLGVDRPVIVRDFPAFLGTMARPRPDDPRVLERFEVYIGGMELANGYSELTDPAELEGRMEEVLRGLEAEGLRGLTVDDQFIEAVNNLPPCAGVSVGMDRLCMILTDSEDISQVVFPYEHATT